LSLSEEVHPVRVEPGGVTINVRADEPVMDAARQQGYRWPNVCGGEAMCGVCEVRVLEGAEHTSPMADKEQIRLRHIGRGGNRMARLACQLTVDGAVTLFKRGVKSLAES
jgi:2Fe-2S ferredoxin